MDPVLEIAEITDRVSKRMGPALLFEKPKGSAHPLLINALGSYDRMNLALGVDSVNRIADRIEALLDLKAPRVRWTS